MEKLICQMREPNELERVIIEWDVPSLKKYLVDKNRLLSLGYDLKEIDHMQVIFFGIKLSNPEQMTYFEKAVYDKDKKTIENYYHYMKKNERAREGYGYTQDDLKQINYVYIEGNPRLLTGRTDDYEIATRFGLLQGNKNKMTEMFMVRYLNESADLKNKRNALNKLVAIYREEEYLPAQKENFIRLISLYPEALEYTQLARSFYVELLYKDRSDEKRYQKICERGSYYEKKNYNWEKKAQYLYTISMFKIGKNGWEYFIANKLEEQTNVIYMKELLEVSGEILKMYLRIPEERKRYGDILQAMAEKAKGEKGGANYSFLLYLNREFGSGFGMNRAELEELYKNADDTIGPFQQNGYGTYLYALAQEHIRIHNTIDEFLYKEELLNLKKEFYGYYSKKIEEYLMGDFLDIKTIGSRIVCINDHVVYGEKKTFKGGKYTKAPTAPRYLQFFPEQDPELYDKYEETIQKALISAKKSNTTKDMLNHLKLSILPDPANILDGNGDKVIKEISFYLWKKIQLNFEQSKDQWLILGKIYECYMEGHRLKMAEGSAEKKIEHRELQMQWARKAVNALRIRAELHGDYYDWYDIYQFYLKRAGTAVNEEEKLDWIKLAYELDLEIVYRIHNDADRMGRHFTGLLDYLDRDKNYFALCIRNEKSIADRYLEELEELYNLHRQYRYLDFAFKIAKVAGNCELYLRKFLKVLLQWEMVKLIRNILDLLFEEKYSVAQLFYDYSVKHIDSIPRILNLTHELMEGLGSEKADRFKRILTLLEFYPNATYKVNIEKGSDETSMLEEVMDLQFVMNYYAATKELIGELDCSSIQRALYLMYQELYSRTMKEEYLKKMFDALEVYAVETESLPFLYRGITLRYRHETLNSYAVSVIEKGKLSPEITDKLKKYQDRLENLKISYGNTQSEFFQELCDLTIYYSERNIVVKLKEFIKKYILSGRNKMTEDLRDYFMSFKMIGKVWLQLYLEENEEAIKKSFPARYTIGFDPVNRVIRMLEDSNKRDQSLLNLDILGECVSYSKEWDNPPMVRLVEDYLENNEAYSEEGVVMLHHFFALMAKGNEDTLYRVIDKINEHHQYKGKQGFDLLEKLYEKTEDTNYLKGLARQYAKAGSYEMAEARYKELSENMVNNPKVKTQILAMSFLIWVKNKEEIKTFEMDKLGEKQVCEALAYLSQKYPHEISGAMNRMDEEGRNLLGYIHQLISLEEKAGAFRDAYEEEEEENLWKALLTLKDTRYFSCLLPNLYQRSRNKKFKYSIENPKDDGLKSRIRRILEEGNHKPILVLYGEGMKPGQELIFMDYDLPAENADRNVSKEKHSIPFLQKVMDDFHTTEEVRPISDLFHQLEGEKSAHRRKDILLHILTNQFDRSEEIERDAALQRKLQLSKAELGYLLHLERFGKKDYEISLRMLHEGTVCLGSSKADCNYLLEKMREQYCKVLEIIPELPFDKGLEHLSLIMDGIDKIIKLFNENWNNSRNVFLRDMLCIMDCLQIYKTSVKSSIDRTRSVKLLEAVMDSLASLKKEERFIRRVADQWESWIYGKLIQLVDQDTIQDRKYFIDRKDSKRAVEDFYSEVIEASSHINLYGPRGMGVSSLLRQCSEGYRGKALYERSIFLYYDSKEIVNSYGIKGLEEGVNYHIQKNKNSKSPKGVKVHLFLDHYEEFQGAAKDEIDLLLYEFASRGWHLIIGSESIIKVEFVNFQGKELKGFSENETRKYLSYRMKYKRDVLKKIPSNELYKLTGGIPALLSYMVEYLWEYNTFTEFHGKAYLISKAKALFEHWDMLWMEKLNHEDNAAYRSHVMAKTGEPEQDISGRLGKLEAKMDELIMLLGKEIYVRQNHLENEKEIDLDDYHNSIQWKQEEEVDMDSFGMSEEVWEVIKKERKTYQYIKYGEAIRRLTVNAQSDYDYSGFALNYCLAFELISNERLKGFLKAEIPEYRLLPQYHKMRMYQLKDIRDTTTFSLGSYWCFLKGFQEKSSNRPYRNGEDLSKFVDKFDRAKNIRNDVAHVGGKLSRDKFLELLSLLLGYKKELENRRQEEEGPPVFESICRLVGMI